MVWKLNKMALNEGLMLARAMCRQLKLSTDECLTLSGAVASHLFQHHSMAALVRQKSAE
jgi:hypothetical protein